MTSYHGKMGRSAWLGCLAVLVVGLAACQAQPAPLKPPEITYGQDICSRCGMIIGDVKFASGTQLSSGDYLIFDDAGEMFSYHAANPDIEVLAWWVHDYLSEAWIDGQAAFYVKSDRLSTPMGSGIACFAEENDARLFATEQGGAVYSFEEIQTLQTQPSMEG